jgi:hypothetical protein
MFRSDPPSSDPALLVGLSAAILVMIGFGLLMHWLMQPTVLPNTPFDMAEQRVPVILRAAPQIAPPDVELSAIAMAARENEIQGLRPVAMASAPPNPSPVQAAAQPATKPAKPKRAVARAPRRDAEAAYASNWWGGGRSQTFGGFGNWHRW